MLARSTLYNLTSSVLHSGHTYLSTIPDTVHYRGRIEIIEQLSAAVAPSLTPSPTRKIFPQ